jgi:hypothetical protein
MAARRAHPLTRVGRLRPRAIWVLREMITIPGNGNTESGLQPTPSPSQHRLHPESRQSVSSSPSLLHEERGLKCPLTFGYCRETIR